MEIFSNNRDGSFDLYVNGQYEGSFASEYEAQQFYSMVFGQS